MQARDLVHEGLSNDDMVISLSGSSRRLSGLVNTYIRLLSLLALSWQLCAAWVALLAAHKAAAWFCFRQGDDQTRQQVTAGEARLLLEELRNVGALPEPLCTALCKRLKSKPLRIMILCAVALEQTGARLLLQTLESAGQPYPSSVLVFISGKALSNDPKHFRSRRALEIKKG